MIEIRGLTYAYPGRERPVFEDLDLDVEDGEILLVTGLSGAGKSSLLRCINGLIPHFHGGRVRGRLRVGGRDPLALGPRGMSAVVGFVPQDPETHFVTSRVEDELAFAMENHGLPRPVMEQRLDEVCRRLCLETLRRRRIETLSGGQAQRVAVGSVLTLRPEILVLDEPTSQLDPATARESLKTLLHLNRTLGLTLVISEHRLERVARHAHRILHLETPEGGAAAGAPARVRLGPPGEVLRGSPLAPPVLRLGEALGWRPPPLSVEQAEAHQFRLDPASEARPTTFAAASPRAASPGPAGTAEWGSTEGPRQVVLSARSLEAGYGARAALAGVDLELCGGELVSVMGVNGAGKTTLLKVLLGLLAPRAGEVTLLGRDLGKLSLDEVARHVGYVPQNPSRLLFQETLADELRFTRRAHGLPPLAGAELESRLEALDLGGLAAAYPRDLSTGQRQRAALAAVLAGDPEILLLDEPTRGLDAVNKRRLVTLLRGLRHGGLAVLLATHDVEWTAEIADRIFLLAEGEVAADGPPAQVMAAFPDFASQTFRLFGHPRHLTPESLIESAGARGLAGKRRQDSP